MAIGDVVNGITAAVGAGASLTFQPAAGVEVLITEAGSEAHTGASPNGVPEAKISLYNGTQRIVLRDDTTVAMWGSGLKIFINNTNYLQIQNDNVGAQTLGFTGVQTGA